MTEPEPRPVDHENLLREAMAEGRERGRPRMRVPEPEELARHFPDYEILGLIGRGGMGAVYKAMQKRLDRLVAIKVLPAELATDPEFGERFLREARALASLNHPHVLTVHDFGETEGLFYLVTEYVDGVDLRRLMDLGKLSPAEALRIVPQLCQALQYAHDRGVVHRDVKPENILIDTEGQVKIADFGLAKLVRPGDPVALTHSSAVFGTPHYMAPEQWRGSGAVDHRADIFSLGVVLYEMLTGQLPIGSFDPPSKRSGVPSGLDEVVRRTLAQQPDDRYQSARDVETDLTLRSRAPARHRAKRAKHHADDPDADRSSSLLRGCLTIAIVLLALVALGFVTLLFWSVAPAMDAPKPIGGSNVPSRPVTAAISPSTLLEATPAEVVARLGPPLAIVLSTETATWSYRDTSGTVATLTFLAGRVVSYDHDATGLQPNARPDHGPYLGQALADLVAELGPPAEQTRGSGSTTVRFADGVQVNIADGVVVAIERR